jgi:hypothetical protein
MKVAASGSEAIGTWISFRFPGAKPKIQMAPLRSASGTGSAVSVVMAHLESIESAIVYPHGDIGTRRVGSPPK